MTMNLWRMRTPLLPVGSDLNGSGAFLPVSCDGVDGCDVSIRCLHVEASDLAAGNAVDEQAGVIHHLPDVPDSTAPEPSASGADVFSGSATRSTSCTDSVEQCGSSQSKRERPSASQSRVDASRGRRTSAKGPQIRAVVLPAP